MGTASSVDHADDNTASEEEKVDYSSDTAGCEVHTAHTAQDDDKQSAILSIPYADYEYPFENLVFEGGGAKGAVYIGCLQVCIII